MASGRGKSGLIAICPACGSEIVLSRRPHDGQLITCRTCDSRLEVVSQSPLELEWAFDDSIDDDFQDDFEDGDVDDWDLDDLDDYSDDSIEDDDDYR